MPSKNNINRHIQEEIEEEEADVLRPSINVK